MKVSETIQITVLLKIYTIFLTTAVVQGIVAQGLIFKSPFVNKGRPDCIIPPKPAHLHPAELTKNL